MSNPMSSWVKIRVLAPLAGHEVLASILATELGTSVTLGESTALDTRDGKTEIPSDDSPPDRTKSIATIETHVRREQLSQERRSALISTLEALARSMGTDDPPLEVEFDSSSDPDQQELRGRWRPFRAGRICVVPPGYPPRKKGDLPLILEPGSAFGSGDHATTRLCLHSLQRQAFSPGTRTLDCGCGSGILSVAMALLGAERVLGFDPDENAILASRELARINGVEPRCEFRLGSIDSLDAGEAALDGIVANLYSDLLVEFSSELARRSIPGGWFVASGFTQDKEAQVKDALHRSGFQVSSSRGRGGWRACHGIRATP